MFIKNIFTTLAGLLMFSSAAIAGDADFTIVNGTGYVIDELYVMPDNADVWGRDILGEGMLGIRQSRMITFSKRNKQCIYDMRIVFEDSEEAIWQDFDLCSIHKITLRYNNNTGKTTAIYE